MISKLLFFGDSITAGNRTAIHPLGDGYVSILKDLFAMEHYLEGITFVNSGVNGHMVGDLLNRYHTDVLDHQPDAVVIKIGINDAHDDFISGLANSDLHKYETGLKMLIQNLRTDLPRAQFFLLTPYLISDLKTEAFYVVMQEYCSVVKALGEKFEIPVLDIQEVFDSAVSIKPASEWADDQIHPHREGHALIANALFTLLENHLPKI
ncbi:MAG: SGNH/GDSL hydrolase family protein [Candidatus Marinimicrobia bacterium]|nr:SGNH/GDSL hydrolase family protein [Candidatus Neomarinimicrobiota bacterium]